MLSTLFLLLGPFLLGYLLGSIPFGLLLTRAAGLGDIRKVGSGNIGATNVLRTGRKGLAAATLLLDALKGVVAVLIARQLGELAAVGAAAGAVLGHMFPVWLSFKGGKGMATTLGVMWGLAWPVGAIACAAWLAVRRDLPLLVAGHPAEHRGRSDRRLVPDRSAGGHAAHPAGAAGVGAPPPEHRPAAGRHRAQDRPARQGRGRLYFRRVKPSGLQSSLPTPWWTKKSPSGSTLSLTCRSRG